MKATVDIGRLRSLIVSRLEQQFSASDAERMADAVLFGELTGRPSHGISRILPGSAGVTDEGRGPSPTIERTAPAAARIEGGPGILVASFATDLAIELAGAHGFAVVTTRGSRSTSGSLTFYVERLTQAGLVAIVSANTLSVVAPWGSNRRVLGTNPIAIGIPAGSYPFIADMATSAITFGEIFQARAAGASIPPGVAVDSDGAVTTDPGAVFEGGALLPFGGHKGMSLAMAVEILNGALAGAAAVPVGSEDVWGHVFIAFSLQMLGDPAEIRGAAQAALDRLSAIETQEGRRVRVPGHRTLMARDASLRRGSVEVDASTFHELCRLVGERSGSKAG